MATAFCPKCERVVHLGVGEANFCPVCATPLIGANEGSYEPDAAAHRLALNEALFREANERIRDATAAGRDATLRERIGFVCECSQVACTTPILLTLAEYEVVRAHPSRFFTVPGHEVDGVEIVIERRRNHQVVEKVGPPRLTAEGLDRRSS